MKTKINLLLTLLVFKFCVPQAMAATPVVKEDGKAIIQVYYFHFSTRCATCRAVESEAKLDVQELFGDDVSFAAYNLDEKAGEAKGKELGINSQMLVVVKGDKKINLTNEGFMYARTNPNKFREIIEAKIKPLL